MRGTELSRGRSLRALLALAAAAIGSASAAPPALAVETPKALLLLPIASGSPGQEWSARALTWILEEGFGSFPALRLVGGTAREAALRELSSGAAQPPEEFFAICRRAGADLTVLGGSTLVAGIVNLDVRVFDIAAGRELRGFRGSEPVARAFDLAEAAIRHLSAEAGTSAGEPVFQRGGTRSLAAYAEYRAALIEQAPAARIEKLRSAVAFDGGYLNAQQRLGVELFRQGALEEAAGVLQRVAALGPGVAEARNNYGVALAAAGKPDQAQREFEAAVAIAPAYAEARLNLARVLEELGRSAEAERQYAAILDAEAGNDKARFGLAVLYDRTGRPELALKEFRVLSKRRPDLAEEEFIRSGQAARKAREFDLAEKYFLRAADINPQYSPAWAEAGTNSYLAGEYAASAEYFRKALAIDPGQGAYHYYLGLALDKGRLPEEALREYRRAVELGGPPESRLGLARAALATGEPALAVEELDRLLAAVPDHAEAKALLARATAEKEARRRLLEGQGQFASQRLARLEQIVADVNRANRELEARLQSVTREKQALEERLQADRAQPAAPPAAPSTPAPAEPRTPADCERALAKARQDVRELALELGREALRNRSWEKAVGYFERVIDVDPRSTEAWGGLREARFQLGLRDNSEQMHPKAGETD
jgi:tetratricopeptide (TPR) repeat protein